MSILDFIKEAHRIKAEKGNYRSNQGKARLYRLRKMQEQD
jgi:hypothetical protein